MTLLKCPWSFRLNATPYHLQFRNMYLSLAYGEPAPWTFLDCHFKDLSFFFFTSNDNRQVAFNRQRSIRGFSLAAEIPEGSGHGEVLASSLWRRWDLAQWEEDKMIPVAWILLLSVSSTCPQPAYTGPARGKKVEWRTDKQWVRMGLEGLGRKGVQIAEDEKDSPGVQSCLPRAISHSCGCYYPQFQWIHDSIWFTENKIYS